MTGISTVLLSLTASTVAFAAPSVPIGIARQLPAEYDVLSSVPLSDA